MTLVLGGGEPMRLRFPLDMIRSDKGGIVLWSSSNPNARVCIPPGAHALLHGLWMESLDHGTAHMTAHETPDHKP